MLRFKLVRSPIGHTPKNRATIQALGLRKMHQTRELPDTPSTRGMLVQVQELLEIDVPEGTPLIADARVIKRTKKKQLKTSRVTPPGAHRKH